MSAHDWIGKTFEVDAPFIQELYEGLDEDGYTRELTWRPGIRWEGASEYRDPDAVANGMGKVRYSVISVHELPRPYPSRVFFTRRWVAPDGREFGAKKLHIMTVGQFRRRIQSYIPAGVSQFTELRIEPLSQEARHALLARSA